MCPLWSIACSSNRRSGIKQLVIVMIRRCSSPCSPAITTPPRRCNSSCIACPASLRPRCSRFYFVASARTTHPTLEKPFQSTEYTTFECRACVACARHPWPVGPRHGTAHGGKNAPRFLHDFCNRAISSQTMFDRWKSTPGGPRVSSRIACDCISSHRCVRHLNGRRTNTARYING